jgi:hypothetical protein
MSADPHFARTIVPLEPRLTAPAARDDFNRRHLEKSHTPIASTRSTIDVRHSGFATLRNARASRCNCSDEVTPVANEGASGVKLNQRNRIAGHGHRAKREGAKRLVSATNSEAIPDAYAKTA